jgi:uncharacterized membrane protein YgcG
VSSHDWGSTGVGSAKLGIGSPACKDVNEKYGRYFCEDSAREMCVRKLESPDDFFFVSKALNNAMPRNPAQKAKAARISRQRVLARKLNTDAQRRPHYKVLTRKRAPFAPMENTPPYRLGCKVNWTLNPLRGHFVAYGKRDTPRCFKLPAPARNPLGRVQELRAKSQAANGRDFYGDRRPRRIMAELIRRLGGGGAGYGSNDNDDPNLNNVSNNNNTTRKNNLPPRGSPSTSGGGSFLSGAGGSSGAGGGGSAGSAGLSQTQRQREARAHRAQKLREKRQRQLQARQQQAQRRQQRLAARTRAKQRLAATKIQAAARGMRNRRLVRRVNKAATKIQAAARGMRNRRLVRRVKAATKIQAAVRKMRNRLDQRNHKARESPPPRVTVSFSDPIKSQRECQAFLREQIRRGTQAQTLAGAFARHGIRFHSSDTIYSWVYFLPNVYKPAVRQGSPLQRLQQRDPQSPFVEILLCAMGRWHNEKRVELRGFAQNVTLNNQAQIEIHNGLRLLVSLTNVHSMERFMRDNRLFAGVMGVLAQGLPWTPANSEEPQFISAGADGGVYGVEVGGGQDRVLKVLLDHWSTVDLVPTYERAHHLGVGPRPYRPRRMTRGAVDLLWYMRSLVIRRGAPVPVTTFMMDRVGTMSLADYMAAVRCPLPNWRGDILRHRSDLARRMRECHATNANARQVLDMFQNVVKRMHAGGIVHGDLHAKNVMVQVERPATPQTPGLPLRVSVIDFDRAVDMNHNATNRYRAMLQNQSPEPAGSDLRRSETAAVASANRVLQQKFGPPVHRWHKELEFLANMLRPAGAGAGAGAAGGGAGPAGAGAGAAGGGAGPAGPARRQQRAGPVQRGYRNLNGQQRAAGGPLNYGSF